jgi:integrase
MADEATDNFTPTEWINLAPSPASVDGRRNATNAFCKANQVEGIDELVEKINSRVLNPYTAANNLVTWLKEHGYLPSTISVYMQVIHHLYEAVEIPIKKDLWRNRVRRVKSVVSHKRVGLSPEQIKLAMNYASPKLKAEIAFLACTGWRREEMTRVRVKDVDFTKSPARVYLWALDPDTGLPTKTGQARFAFLGSEAVELIQTYLKLRVTDNKYDLDKDKLFGGTSPTAFYKTLMRLLKEHNITQPTKLQNGDTIWDVHPHTFRSVSLSIMKRAGFPEDWAEALVGHDTGTQAHYQIEEEMAKEWLDKCERRFKFLTPEPTVVIAPDPKLEKKVQALEEFNKKLLGSLVGNTGATIDGKELSLEQRIERAKQLLLEDKSKDEVGTGA